eukprot:1936149-Pleurochrysis_carterae.AAC.2
MGWGRLARREEGRDDRGLGGGEEERGKTPLPRRSPLPSSPMLLDASVYLLRARKCLAAC